MSISLAEVFDQLGQELVGGMDSSKVWRPLDLAPTQDVDQAEAYLQKVQKQPLIFMNDVLGIRNVWDGQIAVMNAIAEHNQVSVASGHSLGKDFISARLILWFLYSFMPSIVIATAPTDRQVEKIIWGELEEGFYKANKTLPGRILSKELIVDSANRWYAIGFTTKDVRSAPGKFQGFHSRNILLIFSEAQAIERSIHNQAESLMTAGNARWLQIGNPLLAAGPFYETFLGNSGWYNIHLDCEKNPNYLERKEVIPGLASYEWVENMAKKHGRQSPTYISKVKGQFPPRTVDAFIDLEWIQWAHEHGPDVIKEGGPEILGVDVGGQGTGKTIITGRKGFKVTRVEKHEKMRIPEITVRVAELLQAGAIRAYIDATGLGVGLYENLVAMGFGEKVVPVFFGGGAKEKNEEEQELKKRTGELIAKEKYEDFVTQMYAQFAKLLEKHQIAFEYDEDLQVQLINRRMGKNLKTGKLKLEPKEQYIARGYPSPDEADSMVMAFCEVEPNMKKLKVINEVVEDETLSAIWG